MLGRAVCVTWRVASGLSPPLLPWLGQVGCGSIEGSGLTLPL